MSDRKLFGAKLLFHSWVEEAPGAMGLVETSVRVISADSEARAIERAREVGLAAAHSYLNSAGEKVHWVFDTVVGVFEILEPITEDGVEVYSQVRELERLLGEV